MNKFLKYLSVGLLLAMVPGLELVAAQHGCAVPALPPSDCDTCWAARDSSVADSLRRYSPEALADSLAQLQVHHDALAAEAEQLRREISEAEQGLKKKSAACDEMYRTMSSLALLQVSAVDSLLSRPFSEFNLDMLRQVIAVGSRVAPLRPCAVRARALMPLKKYIDEGERMKTEKLSQAMYNTWVEHVRVAVNRFNKSYLPKVADAVPLSEKQEEELLDMNKALWKLIQ